VLVVGLPSMSSSYYPDVEMNDVKFEPIRQCDLVTFSGYLSGVVTQLVI
jgi:hypothetical protein